MYPTDFYYSWLLYALVLFLFQLFKPNSMNSFDMLSEQELANLERHTKKETNFLYPNIQQKLLLNDPTNSKLVNVNEDHIYAVFISCIEIYNNYIYDLLDEFSNSSSSSSTSSNNNGPNGGNSGSADTGSKWVVILI